jgi:hypothetical protein
MDGRAVFSKIYVGIYSNTPFAAIRAKSFFHRLTTVGKFNYLIWRLIKIIKRHAKCRYLYNSGTPAAAVVLKPVNSNMPALNEKRKFFPIVARQIV